MLNLFKKILGIYITPSERVVLDALDAAEKIGVDSHRVVGNGTLIVDSKQVRNTDKFKEYLKAARVVVLEHSKKVN